MWAGPFPGLSKRKTIYKRPDPTQRLGLGWEFLGRDIGHRVGRPPIVMFLLLSEREDKGVELENLLVEVALSRKGTASGRHPNDNSLATDADKGPRQRAKGQTLNKQRNAIILLEKEGLFFPLAINPPGSQKRRRNWPRVWGGADNGHLHCCLQFHPFTFLPSSPFPTKRARQRTWHMADRRCLANVLCHANLTSPSLPNFARVD